MKLLLYGLLALFCLASMGCSPDHSYVYREFELAKKIDVGMTCIVQLRETFINQPTIAGEKRFTIAGSPYKILTSLTTDRENIESATIQSLRFVLATGQILDRSQALATGKRDDLFDPRKHGKFEANFLFRGIDLPHERCWAEIEVMLKLKSGEQIPATYSIELFPLPERREERNDAWDRFMSV